MALKRVVSFSVRTTLCCLFPTTLNISSIYFYMSSVMMSSVSNPFICFWRRATSFACLTASLWHTHRTCFWFLLPWLVVNVVCNENSSCRLFWLCCILFVTDLDVWSGVWSVHRIYGIYILQCTMTILDLYKSCRTWLSTNVLNQLKISLSGDDALYTFFHFYSLSNSMFYQSESK